MSNPINAPAEQPARDKRIHALGTPAMAYPIEWAGEQLAALSDWIDNGNTGRDPEAVTWGRLAKITEEAGEVIAAFIGATGQNPRKGVTHTVEDVCKELLDVAVTALCAYEHLTEAQGDSMIVLSNHLDSLIERAEVVVPRV